MAENVRRGRSVPATSRARDRRRTIGLEQYSGPGC
jgi:hypothetical protein